MTILVSTKESTQIQEFKEFIKTLTKPKNLSNKKSWYSVYSDMLGNIIKLITEDKKILAYAKEIGLK
tara:strand:+ start:298 stop:498 length:201 start_codon:yes stop_codon:yes gene_type:complete